MIKKIIKHYAYCDGCRKPFKMRGSQSVENLSELEQKLELNGWTVINNIGVFCPSCIKKFQKTYPKDEEAHIREHPGQSSFRRFGA